MAAPFWFPDAVLLCALLLTPPKRWWIYLVASYRSRCGGCPEHTWMVLAASYLNDSLKALLAALALRFFSKEPVRFDTFALINLCPRFRDPHAMLSQSGVPGPQDDRIRVLAAGKTRFLGDALANLV